MSSLRRKKCPNCGEMMETYDTFWDCENCGEFIVKKSIEKAEEQNRNWIKRMFGEDYEDDYT